MKRLLSPPNPDWPEQAQAEIDRIRAALGANLLACHHIGSTSVPGLPAKPVIDLLPVLKDLSQHGPASPNTGLTASPNTNSTTGPASADQTTAAYTPATQSPAASGATTTTMAALTPATLTSSASTPATQTSVRPTSTPADQTAFQTPVQTSVAARSPAPKHIPSDLSRLPPPENKDLNALSDESCSGLRRDALISAAFTALGYEALGPFGLPGRLYFRKSAPDGTRLVQAHAYVSGDPAIARHLAFRDLLRADPAARAAYAHVKHTADQTARGNIARYMDLKDAFIKRTERIALLKFPNAADTPQF